LRLIVTGKTRSGKTTALNRILARALRQEWLGALLLDGKGTKLSLYGDLPGVTYLGPEQIEEWYERLQTISDDVPRRFAALIERGLETAPAGEPRYLIVADEVQRGTRRKKLGPKIRDALALIAEQSGALGDVLVVCSQRDVNAIPPSVRINCNAQLRMLGLGYFFYQCDGYPTTSGRVAWVLPEDALALARQPLPPDEPPMTRDRLPSVLGAVPVEPTRAPATLYIGPPGSGKTHALRNHPNGNVARHIYADLAQPHRAILVDIIEKAGAVVPSRVGIPDLAEIAALAVHAEPSLLLFDNLHAATGKTLTSVDRLMAAAKAVALTANEPNTPAERRRLKPFLVRCETQELKPLPQAEARELLWSVLDREAVKKPRYVEKKVLREAQGNPGDVVKLARRIQRGDERELRRLQTPVHRVNIGWIVLLAVIAALFVSRRVVDSYVALFLVTMAYIGLRPFIYKMMNNDD